MGIENGFDASEYVNAPAPEKPTEASLREEHQESPEAIQNRVSRIKNWLHDSVDVLEQAGGNVVATAFYSGKDLAINNYWMTAVPHDSMTTILLGLATGAKLGSYASVALRAIQSELQDPQGRYIRELKRIRREFSEGDPEFEGQRRQHIAEARQQYRQEKRQEESLFVSPDAWGSSSDITARDLEVRRRELARQSERGYLERVLRTRDVPDLPEESDVQPVNRVPDLFPTNEGRDVHE